MSFTVNQFGMVFLTGVVLVILFIFVKVNSNITEYNEYKSDFNKKCIKAGGRTYVPKTKGFSKLICFNKEATIIIGKE